jgi:hypothetical protein
VANKPKTPRPPVQAPKRREEKKQGLRGLPMWAAILGAVVLVAAVVGVVVAATGGGGGDGGSSKDDSVQAAMTAAGCTYKNVPPNPPKEAGNFHGDAPTLTTKMNWATDPPSAGGHYYLWAVWNFYRSPLNPRQVVHNEEHGGVILWWGDKVPSSTVDQLEAFYRESPISMVGTPYPTLGNKIAITAWTGDPSNYGRDGDYGTGHIAICPKFDEAAFKTFRDAYRGEGPEGIPESSNTPGSGPG